MDPHSILASHPATEEPRRVLKQEETFAVFDHYGDIKPVGLGEEGLYQEGTRFLSSFILILGQERPLLLSSSIKQDNVLLTVDLTNSDMTLEDGTELSRGTLHLFRSKFLLEGICHERLILRNYGLKSLKIPLAFYFSADFVDIFEVRGTKRKERGKLLDPILSTNEVILSYEGLDKTTRRTHLEFSPTPKKLSPSLVVFEIALNPKEESALFIKTHCEKFLTDSDLSTSRTNQAYSYAFNEARETLTSAEEGLCEIETSNSQFNAWLNRSQADLRMMTTKTRQGLYPYAGVPWFSTPFGRDGIITALETLWLGPDLARGVLGFLAEMQAESLEDIRDSEPGKILHEMRGGEMAALGEIPFGRYYGSIDSTPLFIVLAAQYYERTADKIFIQSIWPNLERALEWIDRHGDRDGDGFVEYFRHSPSGLVQQGWKDSGDSVFHSDGSLAEGPIALCEVQGYVYAAKQGAAQLAEALGMKEKSQALLSEAESLRERFELDFWCENLSTYALALDGKKRRCEVISSNPGHCLFSGITSPARAKQIAETLLHPDTFCGWGFRTLAASEVRYNPMSYHNGSVWPHDNALIAAGLARYGLKSGVLKILEGLFEASFFFEANRMPELFCGFFRRPEEGPTLYPVACAPQSWAAASVFLLLQAALGLKIESEENRISFSYPVLPESLNEIQIRNLKVGKSRVDLLIQRHDSDVGINVLNREGDVEIRVLK